MNTKRNIRRKLVSLFAAAAFTAPVLSLSKPASALTYVNLETGETSNSLDSGPTSHSYGSSSSSAPFAREPLPNDDPTAVAEFNAYATQVEIWRSGMEAQMRRDVAAFDQEIHKWHVERQMTLSTWHARRNEPTVHQHYANRYHAIQNYICQLQLKRWNLVSFYYTAYQSALVGLKARDPQANANSAWYDARIRYNDESLATVAAQARATYGLPQ